MNLAVAEKQREICRELKNLVAKIEDNIKEEELHSILTRLPNIPHMSTPQGNSEVDNVFYKEGSITDWEKNNTLDC